MTLERLAELSLKATQGEWTAYFRSFAGSHPTVEIQHNGNAERAIIGWTGFDSSRVPQKQWIPNAEFIAALVNYYRSDAFKEMVKNDARWRAYVAERKDAAMSEDALR